VILLSAITLILTSYLTFDIIKDDFVFRESKQEKSQGDYNAKLEECVGKYEECSNKLTLEEESTEEEDKKKNICTVNYVVENYDVSKVDFSESGLKFDDGNCEFDLVNYINVELQEEIVGSTLLAAEAVEERLIVAYDVKRDNFYHIHFVEVDITENGADRFDEFGAIENLDDPMMVNDIDSLQMGMSTLITFDLGAISLGGNISEDMEYIEAYWKSLCEDGKMGLWAWDLEIDKFSQVLENRELCN
jgi:hypothetical protein